MTEAMADRVGGIASGAEAQELVAFMAQFRSRSPRNGMLIYQQWEARCQAQEDPELRPEQPSMLAGYKAFQGMGRQVRKGEKGYQVLSPVTARFASPTPTNADSWRRLGSREKPNAGERVESRMVGVKPATVFDVSQTDGPEIPSLPKWEPLAPGEVPAGLREAIEEEIGREGYSIVGSTAATRSGAEGSTNFVSKEVTFDAERPENEQAATLLHELGHIKLHGPEAGSEQLNSSSHLGQVEFEAETFAHVMAGLHGMDTASSSDAYAAGWTFGSTGGDPSRVAEMTVSAAERVSRAVNDTVERMPVAGDLGDGSLPKTDESEQKPAAESGQERRVRNALRMEAQAPAKIREESPVDEDTRPTVRARR
ncbi:MAG: serine/arginine repetitive matrix protein 2 [Brachybacterium sp.]|uniref:ArdC-like ssDNA-binding domain-containing protein n=1 Tax=Brachybacterium sp. TaxID=1891286 RepID=UPI00264A4219|nr:ImmA/IrrE family metallo-endopeptidase [Brachybacterium sp.]MDN5685837.1 serine/arginine repetitive matrix protein 2 [Brachybacterium sp.]